MQVNKTNPTALSAMVAGQTYLDSNGDAWMVTDPVSLPPPSGQVGSVSLAGGVGRNDPASTIVNKQGFVAIPA
jgi:hypothetical protein